MSTDKTMQNPHQETVKANVENNAADKLLSEKALSEVTGGKDSIRKGLIEGIEAEDANKSAIDGLGNRTHDSKTDELNTPEITL